MAKTKGVDYQGVLAMPGSELYKLLTEKKELWAEKASSAFKTVEQNERKMLGDPLYSLTKRLRDRSPMYPLNDCATHVQAYWAEQFAALRRPKE